ncbi:hypothetical protein [Vibrio metschnikovii]|uniref:hypothetical protein n=1 Tax=Vibrio metschnikovii TaxID=28172 RepID=UPI001C2FA137|nr:hypothetical protein [Vibrio metschnikovii]
MGLFSSSKPSVKTIISEVADLGDRLFTSDKERQAFQYKMELLAASSDNIIARTGRGALMWMFALVGGYNFMIRDMIGIILGRDLPPALLNTGDLLQHLIAIIAGTL